MNKTSFLKKLFAPVDLTKGKPWKVILLFGAPIILSYLLQQIYVLTDAIICGQVLNANEVAGINDTFPLTFIFLQFAFGSTAGFSVITAQHVGSKDYFKSKKIICYSNIFNNYHISYFDNSINMLTALDVKHYKHYSNK